MKVEPRWLNADETAAYISVRPDALPRLVKQGRIPEPSRVLGPRQPRWDRLAIDALFEGKAALTDVEEAAVAIAQSIRESGRRRR